MWNLKAASACQHRSRSQHNQAEVGGLSLHGKSTICGLVDLVLHATDENSKIFATLALNNLSCLLQNAQTIAMSPGALSG